MAVTVSARELIESGAHYGHQTRRWNPKMDKYLHGSQDGVHIFDLIQTKELLEEALKVITEASKQGKRIVLVGTKKQAKDKVKEVAEKTGTYFINERWLGGIVTNFKQIQKSIKKLTEMRSNLASGEYKRRTKKERLLIQREIERLERFFGGISKLEAPPELLVVIDIKREIGAIREAAMKGIDIVGIVDSNCDPSMITYPVPMNDDATKALDYVLSLIEEAIMLGKSSKGTKSIKEAEKKESSKSDTVKKSSKAKTSTKSNSKSSKQK